MAVLSAASRVLVVNAGTSSLKVRALDADDRVLASADLPPVDADGAIGGLERFVRESVPIDAIGHRIVHGGRDFRDSVVVDVGVLERLHAVADLAPLHDPPAIAALEAARRLIPDAPHVACFDTAFHATIPDAAAIYALPREWTERWGIRRYGFHGLSHAYVARRSAELVRRPVSDLRIVSCHLGAGASLAAVAGGRSVDTTMGFTPLEGLVMATRSGSVDPGAILWLEQRAGLSAPDVERTLERGSGLLALAGTADMREVLAAAGAGEARAHLALSVYVHRLRASVAAMAAAMGGVDVLAFAGGVGEGSARIRRETCDGLAFLGVQLDPTANERAGSDDVDVSAASARVITLLIHTREDVEIAREVRRLVSA